MQKKCQTCGNLYTKKTTCSKKEWEYSKYCSRRCINIGRSAWNKGIKGSVRPNKTSFKKGDERCVGNQNAKGHAPWNKGKTWSKETREKISKALMGRPTGRTGVKSNFWKGGKSSEYTKLKNSIEWKNWRRSVFERDDYTCQECGIRSGNGKAVWIHPHHLKSRTEFPELQFNVDNGQTLCRDCHRKTHNYGIKAVRRRKDNV